MFARRQFVLVAALVAFTGSAGADGWPERPVRIIFPYAAGSTGDATARLGNHSSSKIAWELTESSGSRRSLAPLPTAIRSYGLLRRKLRSPR
jgi:hypothetical protein